MKGYAFSLHPSKSIKASESHVEHQNQGTNDRSIMEIEYNITLIHNHNTQIAIENRPLQ